MKYLRYTALAALLAVSACGGPSTGGTALPRASSPAGDFTARLPENSLGGIPCFQLSVALFDAPLTFGTNDQINLALLGVNLVGSDGAHPMLTFKKPVVVDLLTLKKKAQEFQTKVVAGTYTGIEFIVLPSQSSVVVSGTAYPVRFGNGATASATPVAIDSPVTIAGTDKAHVAVTIDFNALESVSLAGGVARIDPRFAASTDETQVHGTVRNTAGAPVTGAAVIVRDAAGATVNTTVTDEDGRFVVHALAAGRFTVAVQNTYTSASGVTVTASGATSGTPRAVNVQLAAGVDLDLGTLAD